KLFVGMVAHFCLDSWVFARTLAVGARSLRREGGARPASGVAGGGEWGGVCVCGLCGRGGGRGETCAGWGYSGGRRGGSGEGVALASAPCAGSCGSSAPGSPVLTLQNAQARVQVSPMIMKVACFLSQHSPMLGQPASSHTVCRPLARMIAWVSA